MKFSIKDLFGPNCSNSTEKNMFCKTLTMSGIVSPEFNHHYQCIFYNFRLQGTKLLPNLATHFHASLSCVTVYGQDFFFSGVVGFGLWLFSSESMGAGFLTGEGGSALLFTSLLYNDVSPILCFCTGISSCLFQIG